MSIQNPYVGPVPVGMGRKLHGRDTEIRDSRDLLLAERIVLLYGTSGAGKTSLIQAGLIPKLEINGLKVFFIARLRGADDSADKRFWPAFVRQVEAQDGAGYVDKLKSRESRAEAGEVVFIFDQFEDVFLDPLRNKERAEFMRDVGNLLVGRNTYALFSMREDHIAELDEYLHLIPTNLSIHFRLSSLNRTAALVAVVETAKEQGEIMKME